MLHMKLRTLIHTALVAEAKPIIGHFGLVCQTNVPYHFYTNEEIALVVSGIGSEKTHAALLHVLSTYTPKKAINIGMAGCVDKEVKKGTLFCTTHANLGIAFATLSSYDEPIKSPLQSSSLLVDMEAESFLHTLPKSIEAYVFKVVSDHLEPSIPSKADVGTWIAKSIKYWRAYV